MNIKECIDCFQFHYNQPVNEKIQSIGIIDDQIFVLDGAKFLLLETNFPQTQFMSQGALVGQLQQARPKLAVNFYRRSDNLFGQMIDLGIHSVTPLCSLCN